MSGTVLIKTDDVSVRIMELGADEKLPWHFHSEVTDYMFCLEGRIRVELRNPDTQVVLLPGQRCEVTPGQAHRVVNLTSEKASYLLVQGIGRYDFVEDDS